MTYKIIKAVVVLLWLFYCIKVLAFRATATRQDAIGLSVIFVIGFAISLGEAIKLRKRRKKEFEARPEPPKK